MFQCIGPIILKNNYEVIEAPHQRIFIDVRDRFPHSAGWLFEGWLCCLRF